MNTHKDKAQKQLHDLLGWGYPDKEVSTTNPKVVLFTCRFCNKHLLKNLIGEYKHL